MSDYKKQAERHVGIDRRYLAVPESIAVGQVYAILALAVAVERLADVLAPAVQYQVAPMDSADG